MTIAIIGVPQAGANKLREEPPIYPRILIPPHRPPYLAAANTKKPGFLQETGLLVSTRQPAHLRRLPLSYSQYHCRVLAERVFGCRFRAHQKLVHGVAQTSKAQPITS